MLSRFMKISIFLSLFLLLFAGVVFSAPSTDDTMLMFVGEIEPVTTVASRRPESPTTAPAIVVVVGREEIKKNGYRTLAELLADQPGFFLKTSGRGTVPYLRGLRDSILFLYDGVPMTTGVNKESPILDEEISLAAVERVEIVRGPGSILWGADAFAGVVNIVPLQLHGTSWHEVQTQIGTQKNAGGIFSIGEQYHDWGGMFPLGYHQQQFYSDDYDSATETSSEKIDPSGYAELVGTVTYSDWLKISGRWSDYKRHYTMQDSEEQLSWQGTKEAPFNYIKASASQVYGASHYTLTGYLQSMDSRVQDADIEREQKSDVSYLEMLWDRRLLERGLLTVGTSWRHSRISDAVIRDGFLPDSLAPDGTLFIPQLVQQDFNNDLVSVFGQLRYQFGRGEWWAGLRYDDDSQYDSHLSYSIGLHQLLTDQLRFKLTYGTAYRSPYPSQLFDDQTVESEVIHSASSQLIWTLPQGHQFELTLFYNHAKHHRTEDPYGGLSAPSKRISYGTEIATQLKLNEVLDLHASGYLLDDNGGSEDYQEIAWYVRPDGSRDPIYLGSWNKPFDQGPKWLVNAGFDWHTGRNTHFRLNARIGGDYSVSYFKGSVPADYSQPLIFDLTYQHPGWLSGQDVITLRITNLFDRNYQQADQFGPVDAPPLQVTLLWNYHF